MNERYFWKNVSFPKNLGKNDKYFENELQYLKKSIINSPAEYNVNIIHGLLLRLYQIANDNVQKDKVCTIALEYREEEISSEDQALAIFRDYWKTARGNLSPLLPTRIRLY